LGARGRAASGGTSGSLSSKGSLGARCHSRVRRAATLPSSARSVCSPSRSSCTLSRRPRCNPISSGTSIPPSETFPRWAAVRTHARHPRTAASTRATAAARVVAAARAAAAASTHVTARVRAAASRARNSHCTHGFSSSCTLLCGHSHARPAAAAATRVQRQQAQHLPPHLQRAQQLQPVLQNPFLTTTIRPYQLLTTPIRLYPLLTAPHRS
ncbi:unnamed protein product, partial [Closterium sp. NIES-64]